MGKVTLVAALLASGMSWAQEVNVYSTTFAQYYKQDMPGFDSGTFAPLTQFLGIDATRLGLENLSLHLFGWGNFDLADQTRLDGKTTGSLTYGYARYRFDTANGEIQAGRFAINHGLGYEQIDGVSGKVDLKGGFIFSAFGGRPVYYKTESHDQQYDYEYQRDVIFGARLGYRIAKIGEIGASFLQDGSPTSYGGNKTVAARTFDYRRRLVGGDFILVPISALVVTGRTVFDVGNNKLGPTDWDNASRVAENDYSVSYRFNSKFSARAGFVERNFQAYFSGSNLPSLFRTFEKDKHRSYSGSATYVASDSLQVTADFRHIRRDTFGDADRLGADVRWSKSSKNLAGGAGYHRVDTSDVKTVDPFAPSFSLSHHELRAWVMYDTDKYSASLDGLLHKFDDADNQGMEEQYLNGRSTLYEVVASGCYKPKDDLRISADLVFGATAVAKNELRGLLRIEYKFGFAAKGGK